ncbi:hypothetical protein ACJX0J_014116, partial [Zea mays]
GFSNRRDTMNNVAHIAKKNLQIFHDFYLVRASDHSSYIVQKVQSREQGQIDGRVLGWQEKEATSVLNTSGTCSGAIS